MHFKPRRVVNSEDFQNLIEDPCAVMRSLKTLSSNGIHVRILHTGSEEGRQLHSRGVLGNMEDHVVREATEDDCADILRLIVELAEFEEMADQCRMDAETLKRDGFGKEKLHHSLVVERKQSPKEESIVGFLLYYWGYSTWDGRTLHIEDLYITPAYRRKGLASALLKKALKIGAELNCKRVQWNVLTWNKTAIAFYKKIGATDLHENEDWHTYRLNEDSLKTALALL